MTSTSWGSAHFGKQHKSMTAMMGMPDILGRMQNQTLEAILATSYKGEFAKSTWDDCVMNRVTGNSGTGVVAKLLGEPEWLISKFITVWDRSRTLRTSELRHMVLDAIAVKNMEIEVPEVTPDGPRIVSETVWKSEFQAEFENILQTEGLDSVVGAAELACLLSDSGLVLADG